MKRTFRLIMLLPTLVLFSACASTPDPAEVCTAEWIAPRTSSAVSQIEKRAKSSMKTLRKASESLAKGKTPGAWEFIKLNNALNKLKKELTRGQGISDLKTVAKTCNDPNIVKDAMRNLLERQGVSESFIKRVESSPIYEGLISSISEPEPVKPNG